MYSLWKSMSWRTNKQRSGVNILDKVTEKTRHPNIMHEFWLDSGQEGQKAIKGFGDILENLNME